MSRLGRVEVGMRLGTSPLFSEIICTKLEGRLGAEPLSAVAVEFNFLIKGFDPIAT